VRPGDDEIVPGLYEAQGQQFGPQVAVKDRFGGVVPVVDGHGGIQSSGPCPQSSAGAVPAFDLVGQDDGQEVLVGQVGVPGQSDTLGQGVKHGGQFEAAQELS
jgi:hypothetical protein